VCVLSLYAASDPRYLDLETATHAEILGNSLVTIIFSRGTMQKKQLLPLFKFKLKSSFLYT
jgi:hypothetical protein